MVNVIIPTYKALTTLPQTLDSLVAQTQKRFFVTIVQDGDGLDYSDIISTYKSRGLHISHINLETNQGPGMARQAGIDASKMFDYVMFCDADDILCPRAVEVLYSESKRNNADILSSNFIAAQNHTPGLLMQIGRTPITWCHGKIYRTKYLVENNIRFLPEFRINEDSYFNLIAYHSTDKHYSVDEVTYIWNDNKNSITRSQDLANYVPTSTVSYILGQVAALTFLYTRNHPLKMITLAATFNNIYDQYMLGKYFGADMSLIEAGLAKIKNIKPLIDITENDKDFWIEILNLVKTGQVIKEKGMEPIFVFYNTNFYDWYKHYIIGDNNASLHD